MNVQNKVREIISEYEKLTEESGFDFVTTELVMQLADSIDKRGTDPGSYIRTALKAGVGSLKHSTHAG